MLTRIRRFLAPPVFEDEDKTRVTGLLNTILLTVLAVAVMYGVASLIAYPNPVPALVFTGIAVLLELGALFLMRRGIVQLTSVLLSSALWVIITLVSLASGGVHAPGYSAYIAVILIAGLLLGGRTGIVFAGLSIVAGWGMLYAEIRGFLPQPIIHTTPVSRWTGLTANFIVAAALLHLATRSLNDALERAHRNERDLLAEVAERARAEETLKRRVAQLALINDIGGKIAAVLELDVVLDSAARLVQESFGYHHVALFTLDRERSELVMRTRTGAFADLFPLDHRLKLGQGMVGWVGQSGERLLANDVDAEPRYVNLYPDIIPTRSELSVPIQVGGEVVGVLDVQSPQLNAFDENDVMVIETLADQIAVAIENARLFMASRHQAEQLESLRQVSQDLAALRDLDTLLRQIVERAMQLLGGDGGGIYLYRPEREVLERVVSIGPYGPALGSDLRRGEGLSGQVWETGEPLIVGDYRQWDDRMPAYNDLPVASVVGVPIRWGAERLGVLNVTRDEPDFFSPADVELLGSLATQAAIALQNARLFEEMQATLTEVKNLAEALRVSEERFALAVRGSNDGIWDWDIANHTLYWSSRLKELLGYADDELEVSFDTFESHLHPGDKERIAAAIEAHLKDRVPYDVEQRLRTKSGEYRWFRARGQAIWDEAGNPLRMVGSTTDITERVQAEEALRKSEERFQRIVTSIEDILYSVDGETREFTYLSPAFEKLLGYTLEDIQQMGGRQAFMSQVIQEGGFIEQEDAFKQMLSQEVAEAPIWEAWWRCKNGSLICLEDRSIAIYDDERLVGTHGVLRDITERVQAEEALARSNRELEQFAYIASHDLQEPLRKVQAFGDRLKARCGEALDEQGRDYLERMQRAATRMQTLINGLLTYSRVTTKAQPFASVDLAQVAREVVSDLEIRIQEVGGQVKVEDLPTIDADPTQMCQLLQNLIGNALKFHREDEAPVVKVYAKLLNGQAEHLPGDSPDDGPYPTGTQCRIFVEDNGIGFDEKYLDRIFQVFQRLHGRGEYEGSGVGLATCRKIVERHGGVITAKSTPGQGTTFIATLPVRQPTGDKRDGE